MITFNYLCLWEESDKQDRVLKQWINQVIRLENKKPGDIVYIICDDPQLLEINQNFLQHDTYTDIITFPTSRSPEIISAEIYVSLPRVIENAKSINKSLIDEFSRVVIHGVLHLIGYDDHTTEEKMTMRAKEDYYLTLRP